MIITDSQTERTVQVFDLRDPRQWQEALRLRAWWGNKRSELHLLDLERVAILLRMEPTEAGS